MNHCAHVATWHYGWWQWCRGSCYFRSGDRHHEKFLKYWRMSLWTTLITVTHTTSSAIGDISTVSLTYGSSSLTNPTTIGGSANHEWNTLSCDCSFDCNHTHHDRCLQILPSEIIQCQQQTASPSIASMAQHEWKCGKSIAFVLSIRLFLSSWTCATQPQQRRTSRDIQKIIITCWVNYNGSQAGREETFATLTQGQCWRLRLQLSPRLPRYARLRFGFSTTLATLANILLAPPAAVVSLGKSIKKKKMSSGN